MSSLQSVRAKLVDAANEVAAAIVVPPPPPPPPGPPGAFDIGYREYAFSDLSDPGTICNAVTSRHTFQTPPAVYEQIWGHKPPSPGYYHRAHNAPVMWHNKDGDWADANDVAQGVAPFAYRDVNKFGEWTWDIFNLVTLWLNGTKRNAGLWLRGNNGNTCYWSSRFATDTTQRPFIRLTSASGGTIDVPCERNIGVNVSTEGALTQAQNYRTAAGYEQTMMWFDLSAYSLPDITSAVLHCFGGGTALQRVGIYRIVNPADPDGDGQGTKLAAPVYGLAANYPNDVGIGNDPAVLLNQTFGPDRDQLWICGGATPGEFVSVPDNNGFVPRAGYTAWKFTFAANKGFSCLFSPWRGKPTPASGKRLKPYIEIDEGYLRHGLLLGLDWDPLPDGGKHFGFDSRYTWIAAQSDQPVCNQIPGMGGGNSGNPTTGFTGSSCRTNYDRTPTPGDPLENTRGFGSGDMYQADMLNAYGDDKPWPFHYLGRLRKARWYDIETHIKMNSVTDPTQHPRHIASLTQTAGVATCVLYADETDPKYAVGQPWQFGGTAWYGHEKYAGEHIIKSIVDKRTFTFDVDPSAPAVCSAGSGVQGPQWLVCAPTKGNFDGILESWVDGKLASRNTTLRWRHSMFRTDGGLYGIDAAWFAGFNGGDPAKTIGSFTYYITNIVFATRYVGPMNIQPA